MEINKDLNNDYKNFLKKVTNRCTDAEKTLEKIDKITQSLNKFFRTENLDSCVLGISGGIDSAVVYALLLEAQKAEDSPIKKIVPLSLPFSNSKGATGQEDAQRLANSLVKTLTGDDIQVLDLSEAYANIVNVAKVPENDEFSWANGQMLSVLRTPVLYHQAALLQKEGYNSIVVGTINQSEFHLGYWGKASDMMVDLQPIINLLKFEIHNIGVALGIPEEILTRTPQGDVSTGETDLEMIGAPYEFIDMYVHDKVRSEQFLDLEKHKKILEVVERTQLKRNSHKFRIGYPCHFLQY